MRYKHPWGTKSHALTILLLPSFERGLFDVDRVASLDNLMSKLAVQALTMGCQSSLRVCMLPPGTAFSRANADAFCLLFSCVPSRRSSASVVGASLAVHLALQTTLLAGVG